MRCVRVSAMGIVGAALLLAACVPVPPAPGGPKGTGCGKTATAGALQAKKLLSGGVARDYFLTVPSTYDKNVKAPVVLNFHGHGSTATEQYLYTQLDAKGAARGFIVVTPNGIDEQWDYTAPSVDFTYAADLVRYLDSVLCIDDNRVFTTGISNGGAFSSSVVCQTGIGFGAFASVTALTPACANGVQVPMLAFHGTADPVVPYSIAGPFTASWATRNGCNATPVETRIEPDIQKRRFVGCAAGLSATLYSVEGGGHTWPDGLVDLPQFGPTTRTIDASDLILDFFAAQ
ncbi:MAG: alpha/beta hydrolase family esterase [Acidimicrobiia bacterium]